jgi:RimJ/RimL family protein N-acetyltransferase
VTAVIETARLLLRPHTLADYEAYCAMVEEPAVYRHTGSVPMTREEAWHRILARTGHWSALGHGPFAVLDKTSGAFLGETGLGNFRRGLGADFDGDDEALWVFSEAVHGKGIAQEAARAALAWYDRTRGCRRSVCIIRPENDASLRLAAKLGYHPYDERPYKDRPVVVLERIIDNQ